MSDATDTRTKSYRGITKRAARHYLKKLGGEVVDDEHVTGDGWSVTLSSGKVPVGPTLELTEVTVVFEGDPDTLDEFIDRFSQKAMRAGG